MDDKILYIVRGVPGSGKSTLAKGLTPNTVEADQFLYNDKGEYEWTPERCREAHKKCRQTVQDYMEKSLPKIAVANTFIQLRDMKPYLELAKQYGYEVVVKSRPHNKYYDYATSDGVEINYHGNVHNVSDEQLEDMKSRFQQNDEQVTFTAYHGSIDPELKIDSSKPLYLCDDYELAKKFACREVYDDGLYDEDEIPTIYKFEGTFKHPYYMTKDEYDRGGQDSNMEMQWFIDNGYDGAIVELDGFSTYYIVFDMSTIKLVNKKVFTVKWDDDSYEIIEGKTYFQDLIYNDFTNRVENLTIYEDVTPDWIREKLDMGNTSGIKFIHNLSKDKLYAWDSNQPWLHNQVLEMVDLKLDKADKTICGTFEPTGVAIWNDMLTEADESLNQANIIKLEEKLFKELYGNNYYVTTCY